MARQGMGAGLLHWRRLPASMQTLILTLGALTAGPGCAGPRVAPIAAGAAGKEMVQPRVAITGMIVNGVTARPLAGAIIDLDDRPGRAESGKDGRFRVDEVPVGMHLLTARSPHFRTRAQPVKIVAPEGDQDVDSGPRNDYIVLLFAPSAYFEAFPSLGAAPRCVTDADCGKQQICLMNNFREMDAPSCTLPKLCRTEADCKLGQQCEPIVLRSMEEVRVCQGQPAPEVEP